MVLAGTLSTEDMPEKHNHTHSATPHTHTTHTQITQSLMDIIYHTAQMLGRGKLANFPSEGFGG